MGTRFEKSWERIIFEKRYQLLRHILFWLIFLVVFSLISYFDLDDFWIGIKTAALNAPVNMIYTYGILLWLVPWFLVKGKYGQFFAFYCVWVVVGMTLNFAFRYFTLIPIRIHSPGPAENGSAYRQIFATFSFVIMNMVAMFAVFIKMFKYWMIEQKQKMQIEKEKIGAELELLKAQLHPHFLFNTFNNLYSLVVERSDKAPEMVLRLSDLLSYVLYECKAPSVPLEKEIEVIGDYVALEQERYGDRLDISLNFSGDIAGERIAPMLFQPFVENAFKHGTSEQIGKVWMSIDLSVRSNELFFRVINSACGGTDDRNNGAGGIGINNVRRRLELLYPGRYTLLNERQEDVYIVSLTIGLRTLFHVVHIEKNSLALK